MVNAYATVISQFVAGCWVIYYFTVCTIFIMPIFGLNQGAQPIIGYNYGAKKFDRVKKTYIYGLIASTVVLTLSWLTVLLLPKMAVEMFTHDEELITEIFMNNGNDGVAKRSIINE